LTDLRGHGAVVVAGHGQQVGLGPSADGSANFAVAVAGWQAGAVGAACFRRAARAAVALGAGGPVGPSGGPGPAAARSAT
jgi:hypothetical protein